MEPVSLCFPYLDGQRSSDFHGYSLSRKLIDPLEPRGLLWNYESRQLAARDLAV